MNQWPTITDPEGRSLMGRAGDLRARLMLSTAGKEAFDMGFQEESITYLHACIYLEDRFAYELFPLKPGEVPIPSLPAEWT